MPSYTPPSDWDTMGNQNKLTRELQLSETYTNAMIKYEHNRQDYIDGHNEPTYEELTDMYNEVVEACNAYPPNTFLTLPEPLPKKRHASGNKRPRPSGGRSMKKKQSRKAKSRRVKPKRTYI
jgi:hypothetical protein